MAKSDNCGRRPGPKDCNIEDMGLTLSEVAVLRIARLYFMSFSGYSDTAWIGAGTEAQAVFGEVRGSLVAAGVLGMLNAIRRSRRSTFIYNSPICAFCCTILTEHERRMMTALRAMRTHEIGRAQVEILMLCEGNGTNVALNAMSALAEVIAEPGSPAHRGTNIHEVRHDALLDQPVGN